ncbi:hypothetical protein HMPREF1084_01924 [Clostridium butyricum 60E.3]|uniref:hypothetical protein n=1 Tax=Clostridium butyricum TaxID=1492 RepID=UPI0002D1DE2C|nr:hypothetical protein [Clostridium butyricum]ALP91167.1 hypothetical protein ATN24_13805 [Clostridium butyricum]ANF14790.1 hypothetical protein AZ909_12260 [Clostridium butyricum]ENZ33455.1 hypothetical protein HMPREF1084_01924 [Clostridium butyricum 60E.3]MCI3009016.1 hypothetical protein [Clostridium butyricum]MDP0841080.1 hypothetical protein [Clostridium butyricum]
MKTLIVYDLTGNLLFTQSNITEQYRCIEEEIDESKEVIGVDVVTEKCILVSRQATTEEKERLKLELQEKNRELEDIKENLIEAQASIVDITYNNLLKENGGIANE